MGERTVAGACDHSPQRHRCAPSAPRYQPGSNRRAEGLDFLEGTNGFRSLLRWRDGSLQVTQIDGPASRRGPGRPRKFGARGLPMGSAGRSCSSPRPKPRTRRVASTSRASAASNGSSNQTTFAPCWWHGCTATRAPAARGGSSMPPRRVKRCKAMPQGSFRYQILEVSKQRKAEAKKK